MSEATAQSLGLAGSGLLLVILGLLVVAAVAVISRQAEKRWPR